MTDDDVVEELPDSTVYPSTQSLDQVRLPDEYPTQVEGYGEPKDLAKAEARLFERIMDPTAPDDNSQKGVYVRRRFEDEAEE